MQTCSVKLQSDAIVVERVLMEEVTPCLNDHEDVVAADGTDGLSWQMST